MWLALPALALALVLLIPRARSRRQAVRVPGSSVLLITLDTTRADRLGYAGCAAARTPNLDRLAAAGVRCSEAYSPVPLTLPAHCSVFSGLYPPAHKVRNNGSYFLPEGVDTLAEILARRGYRTSAFVSSFVLDSRFGLDQGFAVYDDDLAAGAAKTYHSERDAAAVFAAFSRWLDGQEGRPVLLLGPLFRPPRPLRLLPSPTAALPATPMTARSPTWTTTSGRSSPCWRESDCCARPWSSSPAITGRRSGSTANTAIRYSATRRTCACR